MASRWRSTATARASFGDIKTPSGGDGVTQFVSRLLALTSTHLCHSPQAKGRINSPLARCRTDGHGLRWRILVDGRANAWRPGFHHRLHPASAATPQMAKDLLGH